MTETFQITREQAEAYEALFVPALFAQWVPPMLDLGSVAQGQRVLDVACGTGVLTRAAADVVGPSGAVVGLDLNPAMLDVATRLRPDVEWREGDAGSLPFGDGWFDAVLCQSALFFFPDVRAAVAEMARVLRPGGALAVQTYAAVAEQPGFGALEAIVAEFAPADALHLIETYWSQGDLPRLCGMLEAARVDVVETRTVLGTATYASIEQLVEIEIMGTSLAERLTSDQVEAIRGEAEVQLSRYLAPGGPLELPIRAHLVGVRKR